MLKIDWITHPIPLTEHKKNVRLKNSASTSDRIWMHETIVASAAADTEAKRWQQQ